ncbi:MAG TPA: hypothetical protein QGI71_07195 [Dehalococcoidia bacterium]|jgi:hypothetical protein|nr:hypothetical protein [Dehalococcoidia bacterium]
MLDGGPGFEIDIEAVHQNVQEAEVVALYFPMLRKTLLVDTRSNDNVDPMVCVVDMVQNAGERFRSLRKLRPQLPRPQSITLIPWVLRVDSLRQTGVWADLTTRLHDNGECMESAAHCLDQLDGLEQHELQQALTGKNHRTLWGRLGIDDDDE